MGWFGSLMKHSAKAVKWIAPAALAPLTGGASLAAYGVYGQQSANKTNIAQSREQMDFQERMSSTEMQRRVNDLKMAGLNPMLAYSQGGASSAQGAKAEVGNELSAAVNSANAMRMQKAQIENMQANTAVQAEQAQFVRAQTQATTNTASKTKVEEEEAWARIDKNQWEIDSIKKDVAQKDMNLKNNERVQQISYELQLLAKQAQDLNNQALAVEVAKKTAEWRKWLADHGIGVPTIKIPFLN